MQDQDNSHFYLISDKIHSGLAIDVYSVGIFEKQALHIYNFETKYSHHRKISVQKVRHIKNLRFPDNVSLLLFSVEQCKENSND